VIRAVGQRLGNFAGEMPGALAARLQGEELAVLVPGIDTALAARAMGDRIRKVVREPVHVAASTITVSASVGVATSQMARPDDAFDEILARADLAMHEAEGGGRDRTVLYDAQLAERLRHRRSVDQQLRRALDSDGLCMRFQPIVELPSRRVVGAEALLRVRGDDGELLSPGAFVETAESSGLISRLGAAVVRATCEHIATLGLHDGIEISVNVSPRQMAARDFAPTVLGILADTGVAPGQLKLEITEGAFFGRDDASENNILQLRDEGVRVGLDEFGGDTSLGYLRRFPLDFVKIDRSLIAGLGANYVDGTIVRATIELAHKLGLTTVAVGVETDEQRSRLEQLGCDRAQGYLFGAAVSPEELPGLLDRNP
jgi:predicted signal transduction protein with EAL and GGDEF domain